MPFRYVRLTMCFLSHTASHLGDVLTGTWCVFVVSHLQWNHSFSLPKRPFLPQNIIHFSWEKCLCVSKLVKIFSHHNNLLDQPKLILYLFGRQIKSDHQILHLTIEVDAFRKMEHRTSVSYCQKFMIDKYVPYWFFPNTNRKYNSA